MLKRGVFLVILACCSIGFCQSTPNTPPVSQANTPVVSPANIPQTIPQSAQSQTPPVNTPVPNAQQKSFGNFWNNMSTGDKIQFGIFVLMALSLLGGRIVWLCSKLHKEKNGDTKLLVDKLTEKSERAGNLEAENSQLKNDLANALNRVEELKKTSHRDEATTALDAVYKSGDTTKLLVLIANKNLNEDPIERNREISAITYLQGDIDTALAAVDEILKLLPDDLEALNRKGNICDLRGDLPQAIQCYGKVLQLAKVQNNEEAQAASYGNLGNIYQTHGEFNNAIDMYNRAFETYRRLDRQKEMAITYGNLGNVFLDRGEFDHAVDMYNKALEIDCQLKLQEGMASQYGNLGNVYLIRGKFDKAVDMYNKVLAIEEKLGGQESIANAYGNLGVVYAMRGKFKKATEMYSKSLEINQRLGRQEGMANDYCNLGNVYQTKDDKQKARQYYLKSIELFRKIGIEHTVKQVEDLLKKLDEK